MMRLSAARLRDDRGVVLIMVLAFAIVVAIGGLTFMQSGQLEARNATQRTQSEQAFWLAEAAYGRATAELWKDASWGVGTPKTVTDTLGGGDYAMIVRDTTISGVDGYRFIVWGTVAGAQGDAQRRIDIATTQKLAAFGNTYSIIAGGDVNIQSAAAFDNIGGNVHADGDIDVPASRTEQTGWDENIELNLPPIYTTPDSLGTSATTTYYYVQCVGVGVIVVNVLDRNGLPFFPPKLFTPANAPSYSGGRYRFNLSGNDFDWTGSGPFKPLGGATNVVVNFGEYQMCDITFDGGGPDIKSTIINTKYNGPATVAGRLDDLNWTGGTITLQANPTFAPTNGLALIVKDLVKAAGGSNTQVGSPTVGACVYATGDISGTLGTVTFYGTLLALGDVSIGGGTTVVYSSNYYGSLPGPLVNRKQPGTSASMTLVHWKELSRW